jgi:23S rRNA pseudouridine1911/1915/1917 synthase
MEQEEVVVKFKLEDQIIFEDDAMIVLNKPSGALTLPDRHDNELISLRGVLDKKFGKIFVVHRLDKETSGVIVFAKNEETHRYLSMQFEGRNIEKYYAGLVQGQLLEPKGTVDIPISEHPNGKGMMMWHRNGKSAVTDYEVLENFGLYSWMQFQIHTGRTHQIRVHCKYLGHPLVGDPMYGDGQPFLLSAIKRKFKLGKDVLDEKPILARTALHAHRLIFKDAAGKLHAFEAPLPKDLRAALQQLRKVKGFR